MLPLHLIFCWIRAESKECCWELRVAQASQWYERWRGSVHQMLGLSWEATCHLCRKRGTKNRIYKLRAWEFLAIFLTPGFLNLVESCWYVCSGPWPLLWTFYPQPGDISPAEGCETWKLCNNSSPCPIWQRIAVGMHLKTFLPKLENPHRHAICFIGGICILHS